MTTQSAGDNSAMLEEMAAPAAVNEIVERTDDGAIIFDPSPRTRRVTKNVQCIRMEISSAGRECSEVRRTRKTR